MSFWQDEIVLLQDICILLNPLCYVLQHGLRGPDLLEEEAPWRHCVENVGLPLILPSLSAVKMTPEVSPPPRPSVEAVAFAPVSSHQGVEAQQPTHEVVHVESGQLAKSSEQYGWRTMKGAPSLEEVNSSVAVPPASGSWHAKLKAFAGLGFVISVGYMDPGASPCLIDGARSSAC